MDNEMLSEDQLFPDNFAKREILSLTVRCPNLGCADKMELRHLEVKKTVTDMFDPNTEHEVRDVNRLVFEDAVALHVNISKTYL